MGAPGLPVPGSASAHHPLCTVKHRQSPKEMHAKFNDNRCWRGMVQPYNHTVTVDWHCETSLWLAQKTFSKKFPKRCIPSPFSATYRSFRTIKLDTETRQFVLPVSLFCTHIFEKWGICTPTSFGGAAHATANKLKWSFVEGECQNYGYNTFRCNRAFLLAPKAYVPSLGAVLKDKIVCLSFFAGGPLEWLDMLSIITIIINTTN